MRPMPPSPSLADYARTTRVLLTDLTPFFARLAVAPLLPLAGTNTAEGLARTQRAFGRTLRRLGITLEVRRVERVPSSGGLVLMWNQETHLDHLILAASAPRPFFSIYNNAVARTPLYGAHMRASGHVHVDRRDPAQWQAAIAGAAARVRAGECVLVSPEGTRSRDGQLLPLKRGALQLAVAAAAPIVCVTVIGGHARLPLGSAVVRSGPVRVVFSAPLAPEADPEALRERLQATFEATKQTHALSG